jgi:hypothetical protein
VNAAAEGTRCRESLLLFSCPSFYLPLLTFLASSTYTPEEEAIVIPIAEEVALAANEQEEELNIAFC